MMTKLIPALAATSMVLSVSSQAFAFHFKPSPIHYGNPVLTHIGQTYECIKYAPASNGQLFGQCLEYGWVDAPAPGTIQ